MVSKVKPLEAAEVYTITCSNFILCRTQLYLLGIRVYE